MSVSPCQFLSAVDKRLAFVDICDTFLVEIKAAFQKSPFYKEVVDIMQMNYKTIGELIKNQMIRMVLHNLLYENIGGQTQAAMLDEFGLDWGDQEKAKKTTQQYYMCAICSYLKNEKCILSREQKPNGDGGKWYIASENREKALKYLEELESMVVEQTDVKCLSVYSAVDPLQKVFFGAPGTGKSYRIDALESEGGLGLKAVPKDRKFRTTFHPDYDYAQFVGSYKPVMQKDDHEKPILANDIAAVGYKFVPQAFANAYAAAWSDLSKPIYLVIEEINRGNCAQIFGDIFQLLDRDDEGYSRYEIDADADFAEWLGESKLRLPPNFNILATMNTSDQSLFPMDSAFKRRFDWEYVAIDYKKTEADFTIVIGDKKYRWLDFLKKVNADIYKATESEDKQMGEFFVKPRDGKTIDLPNFCSKVLFYLWDSVYKDDEQNKRVFHFDWKFDGEEKTRPVTFQSLFEDEQAKIAIVQKMMENLGVEELLFTESADDLDDGDENSGSKRHLIIEFSDGTSFNSTNSTENIIGAIKKIGVKEAASVGVKVAGYDWISKDLIKDNEGYRRQQKELSDGYYLMSKLGTDYKKKYMDEIKEKLHLDYVVTVVG